MAGDVCRLYVQADSKLWTLMYSQSILFNLDTSVVCFSMSSQSKFKEIPASSCC